MACSVFNLSCRSTVGGGVGVGGRCWCRSREVGCESDTRTRCQEAVATHVSYMYMHIHTCIYRFHNSEDNIIKKIDSSNADNKNDNYCCGLIHDPFATRHYHDFRLASFDDTRTEVVYLPFHRQPNSDQQRRREAFVPRLPSQARGSSSHDTRDSRLSPSLQHEDFLSGRGVQEYSFSHPPSTTTQPQGITTPPQRPHLVLQ